MHKHDDHTPVLTVFDKPFGSRTPWLRNMKLQGLQMPWRRGFYCNSCALESQCCTTSSGRSEDEDSSHDALLLAWGRTPRVGRGFGNKDSGNDLDTPLGLPWHSWTNRDRILLDWGTGTKTRAWIPPHTSERMRAQRAGFLFDAAPILTSEVVDIINKDRDSPWEGGEIANATSVIGVPSISRRKTVENMRLGLVA